jgi:NADH-quinone oxidoreductase subunit L
MQTLLFLIPALPLFSSLGLGILGHNLPRKRIAQIGAGSIGIAALLSIGMGANFLISPPPAHAFSQTLWTWMQIGTFCPKISFRLDALSLVMTLVVLSVSFLIHLYSAEFMWEEEGYSRFFAYMNLFVASMLILVLADNLLFLYLGWEGVGLCSYLLIGFWYKDPANGRAARKAFLITRIGDTAMAIGFFLLFVKLGTLEIQPLLEHAATQWPVGSHLAITAAALLLGGAVGKSAQIPLQTWLPDAMAGPTPVSALIHAATMVTAGVYLIARTHTLFTLLISAWSALTQSDIKRVLAYSTMSQIGYMFLALGVGAWSAAIFHFVTHALFKALLFLSAGAIILSLHHEHNIFKMGGLRRQMPWVFWTFLIGAASLSSLPLITSGFYSKEWILTEAYTSPVGSPWLWAAGLLGAFLTSLYSFRLVFIVFFGETRTQVTRQPGFLILAPLVILAGLSLIAGFVELPPYLGNHRSFSRFLEKTFIAPTLIPPLPRSEGGAWLPLVASLISISGIAMAYLIYLGVPKRFELTSTRFRRVQRFFFTGWGFDQFYDTIFVRPFLFLAKINRNDAIDLFFNSLAWLNVSMNRLLSRSQNGRLRWYAAVIGTGAAVLIALAEVL